MSLSISCCEEVNVLVHLSMPPFGDVAALGVTSPLVATPFVGMVDPSREGDTLSLGRFGGGDGHGEPPPPSLRFFVPGSRLTEERSLARSGRHPRVSA